MSHQRDLTNTYFNKCSPVWAEAVYKHGNRYHRYPTSLIRDGIIHDDLAENTEIKKILDFGCGSGEMVKSLLEKGYEAQGFDLAVGMLERAKQGVPDNTFWLGDAEKFQGEEDYDVAIAAGVIPYLEEDLPILRSMVSSLRQGGKAYVTCRNKLFNTTTANSYTMKFLGDLPSLLHQFDDVERFSKIKYKESEEIQKNVAQKFVKVAENIDSLLAPPEDHSFPPFPKELVRKFHTPLEMEVLGKEVGLTLERIVYFHLHPLPPAFQSAFPSLFNAYSLAMQPFGETPLGAYLGSGFVAIYKKES